MKRDSKGRFVKGAGGRPRGARNRVSRAVEVILEGDAKAVARALVKAAKGGDVQASIAILRAVAPPPKGRSIVIGLPTLKTVADAPSALAKIVTAVAAGEISPAEGHELASLVDTWRAAIHTADLEVRLQALEAASGQRQ